MIRYLKPALLMSALIICCMSLSAQIYLHGARTVVYDSANGRWLVSTTDTACRVFSLAYDNRLELLTSAELIRATTFAYNVAGNRYLFFGANKYMESGQLPVVSGIYPADSSFVDSIKPAQQITGIAFANNRPALAIIRNDSLNYLFRKNGKGWSFQGVAIGNISDLNTNSKIKQAFWMIGVFLIGSIIYCIVLLRRIYRSIRDEIIKPKENPLLTKSEIPIGLKNQDLLGFEDLEDAVVSIIKNPQTQLPLSIVINGSWGSGKTSMMNRIREKLEADNQTSDRFITTWFNAWHLQGESSLLNTFLLNIIDAYEKAYSFVFRLKLAVRRFTRLSAFKQIGFGFAIAVIGPIILYVIINLFFQPAQGETGIVQSFCTSVQAMFTNVFTTGFSFQAVGTIAALIFTVISYLFLNRQFLPSGLSAFFELIPKNSFQFDVEKAPPGYREKFKKDYWEIIDAGKEDKRLVVFIDDIDRISGDKILELLEGINFISDIASKPSGTTSESPNTVFILGMYMSEVAKNLGSQLEKLNGTEQLDSGQVKALGNRYLEKMIQLIVPVPFDTKNARLNCLYENE